MEITKKTLEEKLNQFIDQHRKATEELNRFTILVRKYEGAIEATQLLLKEMEEPEKKSIPKK